MSEHATETRILGMNETELANIERCDEPRCRTCGGNARTCWCFAAPDAVDVTAMRMAKDAIKKARACEVIKPVDICYDPWHKEAGPSAERLRCPTCGWSS